MRFIRSASHEGLVQVVSWCSTTGNQAPTITFGCWLLAVTQQPGAQARLKEPPAVMSTIWACGVGGYDGSWLCCWLLGEPWQPGVIDIIRAIAAGPAAEQMTSEPH